MTHVSIAFFQWLALPRSRGNRMASCQEDAADAD
jgi:hypothetical protein